MTAYAVLKRNGEFRRAYARGVCLNDSALGVYIVKNKYGNIRLGITTGKKLGNAVERSRARRIIREAFRSLAPELKTGCDYVIVARSRILTLKSTDVAERLKKKLSANGYINQDKND